MVKHIQLNGREQQFGLDLAVGDIEQCIEL
jgi:hypothetical protein